ncbi:UDP-N-acetylmuramate--L-alanine ligase [Planctomicrobium sp. SH664]|uniref:UDP-N-acetylmuramate--L-alanine ligase n=1 Tax=Planctomicrobium sp. SH664 TaxID=3448125 RepID=UPI003F5AE581
MTQGERGWYAAPRANLKYVWPSGGGKPSVQSRFVAETPPHFPGIGASSSNRPPVQLPEILHSADDLIASRQPPRRAHLLGICGAGMKALAEVLAGRGWEITGCDLDPDPLAAASLERRKITPLRGHHPDHLTPETELLIYSSAVPPESPERQRAEQLDIPQFSYVEALAALTRHSRAFAVAGTHGKSTTTAMLGTILQSADRSPTVICGAELIGPQSSGWSGTGPDLVVEACEYRRHFLELQPHALCLLGIEPDHFDCYPHFSDAIAAYRELIDQVPSAGVITYRSDCLVTAELIGKSRAHAQSFSVTDATADWHASTIVTAQGRSCFVLRSPSGETASVQLQVAGHHNVANALSAAACAAAGGVSFCQVVDGLQTFAGVRRRGEAKGLWRGAHVIDDYAHHPTEIRCAIAAAREAYRPRRLISVFQPHQISRTRVLLGEFAAALAASDRVHLLPVYAARESAGQEQIQLVAELAAKICELGTEASLIKTLDHVWPTLQTDAGNEDLILTLGAGDLTRVHHECI